MFYFRFKKFANLLLIKSVPYGRKVRKLELGLNLEVVFLTFPIVSKRSYVITIFQNGLFLQKNSLESLETVKSVKNSSENLFKIK